MASVQTLSHGNNFRLGILLVAGSAILWSFGGTIARFITEDSTWTVVFWRSYFAALFLIVFLVWRDGLSGTVDAFRAMGRAGLAVAFCFAVASTSFVVALGYTSVANILLMQAGVPLVAALLSFILFRERVSATTWIAIAAVIVGVAIMVSQSLTGKVSGIGDGLAFLIMILFSIATVITRRAAHVRMTPAVCLGTVMAAIFSGIMAVNAGRIAVSWPDFTWLIAFGAINLGAGLAMFALGARLIPAAIAALIGTIEPVLAPLWVWMIHAEVPSHMTLIGGAVVFAALTLHLLLELRRSTSR